MKDKLNITLFGGNEKSNTLFRKYRSVLSPPFHFDAIKLWADIFRVESETLCDIFSANINNPINITEWLPRFTIDVLGTRATIV